MTATLGPPARSLEVDDDYAALNELFVERGWTDGLPIVPPTEDRVVEFLRRTSRNRREVVAVLPPRQGEATVEKLAINAVMAGCRPEYFPVLLAAALRFGPVVQWMFLIYLLAWSFTVGSSLISSCGVAM